jgi:hypothetical protein
MEVEKKLHEVGTGVFTYTQLPGSWGWSNTGLIVDGDQSLLVDTLFDRRITDEMLSATRTTTMTAVPTPRTHTH